MTLEMTKSWLEMLFPSPFSLSPLPMPSTLPCLPSFLFVHLCSCSPRSSSSASHECLKKAHGSFELAQIGCGGGQLEGGETHAEGLGTKQVALRRETKALLRERGHPPHSG